jgi:hypothetical protein
LLQGEPAASFCACSSLFVAGAWNTTQSATVAVVALQLQGEARKRRLRMPRYSKSASKDVKGAMSRKKKGTLRSGPGGKGGKVKSRAQAVAIGLSEARKKGKKVPAKRKAKRK